MTDPRPTFDLTVERLRVCRDADDRSRWAAGDCVVEYLGRSEHSDDVDDTLNRLAAHSGFHRAGLRERYHCSRFWWPAETRRWENVCTWSHHNRARRVGDFETACDWMERAENGAWSVAQLERELQLANGHKPADNPHHCAARASAYLQRALAVGGVSEHYRRGWQAALDALESVE